MFIELFCFAFGNNGKKYYVLKLETAIIFLLNIIIKFSYVFNERYICLSLYIYMDIDIVPLKPVDPETTM